MQIQKIDLSNEKLTLSKQLENLLAYARKNYIPVALDDTIKFLKKVLLENKPENILEIGTAIGYSGIIMLDTVKNSNLTTIEYDTNRYNMAKQNFKNFGVMDRVIQINGDALVELQKLCIQNKKFDFIFLDGPKGQYLAYLPFLKKLMTDNAILFADDVLLMGLVQGEQFVKHKHRAMILKLRQYLDKINCDGLCSVIYDVGEGVAITKKVKGEI